MRAHVNGQRLGPIARVQYARDGKAIGVRGWRKQKGIQDDRRKNQE
jgi:hypothetical protein